MKKNWILKLALLAMVLTLVTMPLVSGTYAKYTISKDATDTARVAKWGVNVAVTGGAFATTSPILVAQNDKLGVAISNSVASLNGTDKIIAPGTTGTFTGVAITGQPEVAVNIEIVPEFNLTGTWEGASGVYYCPLVITVNGTDISGLDYTSVELFEKAVEDAIEASEGNYQANTNLAGITGLSGSYSWAWAIETAKTPSGNYNTEDTYLGNLAKDAPVNISLKVTATVTQID